jgi:cytochrome c peroxidase
VTSNKISGKGAYTPMRVKNTTQRFQVFVRDLQESFWGDFQGQTREMLKKLLDITGVAGINDDVSAGGLVKGGIPLLTGTCGTCHNTPNVGNHSFPTPLNIGTGDPDPSNVAVNLGGLDVSYLASVTVCKLDLTTSPSTPTSHCKTTTDLGQALIDGRFDHLGKIKGPILRGRSARAPYFHNGSAETLLDVVHFYENRFGLVLTPQEESDLVAFLSTL